MAIQLSFVNLVATTGTVLSATSQLEGYCSTNLVSPQRPFLPWRTDTTTSTAIAVIDLGSSQTVTVIALVNANFTCARIQGASSSGFGTISYNQQVEITRNPWTGRLQHVHVPSGFGYRYLALVIPLAT